MTMTEESISTWRTSDMALVAYMTTLGMKYIEMELDTNNTPVSCYWVFEETDNIGDVVFNYLEGKGTVEPKGFNSLMSQLKNGMFAFFRQHGIDTTRR